MMENRDGEVCCAVDIGPPITRGDMLHESTSDKTSVLGWPSDGCVTTSRVRRGPVVRKLVT